MRLFSFFLPQFHEIPENDEWWGKGFTEWVNVKAAKPLYPGHVQPKHPIDNNYYNLLEKNTVIQQTALMHEYGLNGMIYYHYYFKGKLLLEKPAENLLHWKEIDQPFFFCWANHDWIRSWEGKKTLLMKQEYGDRSDWETHFQYLIPFFKDKRYEKKNNMPLFMLFNYNFYEKEEMFTYLDKRCKDFGFDGLYLIEAFAGTWGGSSIAEDLEGFRKQCSTVTKDVFIREPLTCKRAYIFSKNNNLLYKISHKLSYLFRRRRNIAQLDRYRGSILYNKMIYVSANLKGIHGLFFEWDNTPRHKQRGYVITPPPKHLFSKYMNKIKDDEYVFVNAWNEWCEGMMLEPTVEDGYKYLEWIKEWKGKNG